MEEYLSRFILWDSTMKNIIVALLSVTAAFGAWRLAVKLFPKIQPLHKDGRPVYMPFARVLVMVPVFAAVFFSLSAPQSRGETDIQEEAVVAPEAEKAGYAQEPDGKDRH
ncbi:MAG: hypothetical protein EA357_11345 [Micavibrio sp.]|jgi:hypothetical protein|nr:MAG: hypothetical protein EA357_11345 [Micavibrio sp.]